MYVVKLDGNGYLQWNRTIGGTMQEDCRSIIQTQDGGYAIAGTTGMGNANDFYIAKLDVSGNLQWTRTVGGTGEDRAYSIIQSSDGNYIIVGTYDITTNYVPWGDIYAVKLDGSGNLLWSKTVGGNYQDWGCSVKQTADGGFVVAGVSRSFNSSLNYEGYVIKLDSNWASQWTKIITGGGYPASIIQTKDGGFAITSITGYGAGNGDIYLVKLYSGGGLQWTKTVGGTGREEGHSIIQSNDGGYIISGSTESFGNTTVPYTNNIYLVKFNSSGVLQWTKTSGGTDNDMAHSITKTTDGGFAITGYKDYDGNSSPPNTYPQMYIMKLDSLGNGCCVSPGGGTVSSGGTTGNGGVVTNVNSFVGTYGVIGSGGTALLQCSNGCVPPLANAGIDNTICVGTTVTLNGNGGNNYSWINATNLSNDSIANPLTSPTTNTTYILAVSNACGSDTDTVSIYVLPIVTATISGLDTICAGNTTTLSASGGAIYSWNTGATSSSIIIQPTVNTTFSVSASNAVCSHDTSILVVVHPLPLAAIVGSPTICSGDSTILYANGTGNYFWSTGTTGSAIVVSPSSNTTYMLSVTDSNYCTDTASLQILVTTMPLAVISPSMTICEGATVTLSSSGGTTYSWSTGQITPSIQASPNTTTNYSVVISNASCFDTAYTSVTVNPNPVASTSGSLTIYEGQTISLTANGGESYAWNNGETTSAISVSPAVSVVYCVTVADTNNCKDTACLTVSVEIPCNLAGTFYFPTAFSPNGDGENDSLQVYYRNMDCIETLRLSVYNRWGEKVYETADKNFRWGGNSSRTALNSQVFTCSLSVTFTDGKEINLKRNISLLY